MTQPHNHLKKGRGKKMVRVNAKYSKPSFDAAKTCLRVICIFSYTHNSHNLRDSCMFAGMKRHFYSLNVRASTWRILANEILRINLNFIDINSIYFQSVEVFDKFISSRVLLCHLRRVSAVQFILPANHSGSERER